MLRAQRTFFLALMLALSWLGMQIVHELGHVLAAVATGGNVQRVVLHPLQISRTDVQPNPHPLVVAWSGPIFGAVAPVVVWLAVNLLYQSAGPFLQFFAGFCLIANGAYIGCSALAEIGDAAEILSLGGARWPLLLFGVVAVSTGLWVWHLLGKKVNVSYSVRTGAILLGILATVVAVELVAYQAN